MRIQFLRALLLAGIVSAPVFATVVSLKNDFSIANGNPNGQWSYTDNATSLSLETPVNNGNSFYPAASAGYWGVGTDLNTNTPEILKVGANGSAAGGSDADFLIGDVVGHSANDGSILFASWIAPSNGTISALTMSIWYAHSRVERSDDFGLFDNASLLTSGTVNGISFAGRDNAYTYSNAGFSVVAGDVISLGLVKSSQQINGALAGMNLDFTFTSTATPEPATWSFMALGLAGMVMRVRSRRRNA